MTLADSNPELPSPPRQPWRRILATAVLLTLLVVVGAEWACRVEFALAPPTELVDDARFWVTTRAKLRDYDPQQIILLGDSRMQCDLAPEVLADELRCEAPLQLAISAATPIPTLRHIAEESHFSGVVLCDIIPYFFFNASYFSGGAQQKYVDAWNAQKSSIVGIASPLRRLRNQLTIRGRIAAVRYGAKQVAPMDPAIPSNPFWTVLPDRSIAQHFSRADRLEDICLASSAGARNCPVPPISESDLVAEFAQYEGWVRQIMDRGGQVIFVRLPVSGIVLEAEEEKFPRDDYWRRMGRSSSAQFLDCADYPSLAEYTCPDGSHLDANNRAPFTKEFAAVLKEFLRKDRSQR
jgi:hypothetical protein